MVSQDGPGRGRVIAYAGDTWTWATASEEGHAAHRKLWRQIIFWLSHKENDGDNQVNLTLKDRRVSVGDKIEITAAARDAKGVAISNVRDETKIEREKTKTPPTPVDLLTQGDEARGSAFAVENLGEPGNYTVTTIARKDGQKLAGTPRGFWSIRMTVSWKTHPPTSLWHARSPRSRRASTSRPNG